MFAALNVVVILMVLLIAYWWATQGLFSAILHLVCVVTAATIAFSFWEPLVVGVLLRGGGFDNYAWGLGLGGLFTFALLLLRVIMDRAIPGNVQIPRKADLIFGFPVGAASGVLTAGMFIISAGFMQSLDAPFGYQPAKREAGSGAVELNNALWLPVDQITSDFFSFLSVSSLATGTPLRQVNPNLWQQASLLRDTFNGGSGMFAMPPRAVEIGLTYFYEPQNTYAVQVSFKREALDFGTSLALSSAQVRLVGKANGMRKPTVLHPTAWRQPTGYYRFDDVTHYISTQSGQQDGEAMIEFRAPADFVPDYIQIRNIRYPISSSRTEAIDLDRLQTMRGTTGAEVTGSADLAAARLGGPIGDDVIFLSDNTRPIRASTNQALGTLTLVGNKGEERFESGSHKFLEGGQRPSRNLMVKGLYEPPGTRIVQLDVSRGTTATIYGEHLQGLVTPDDPVVLVDDRGNTYRPIGYIHTSTEGNTLNLDPVHYFGSARELPILPSSGSQSLRLLFIVTEGVTVTKFRFGPVTIGTCRLLITPPGL